MDPIRFASFNASLTRSAPGELIEDLSTTDNTQAQMAAEVIQRADPDVILINEFDYDPNEQAAKLFQENYLSVSQNGATTIDFPYVYQGTTNTGEPVNSPGDLVADFNHNGVYGVLESDGFMSDGNDAYGFGTFPGQYGMLLLSQYPLIEDEIRTFQDFIWQDMPNALLPIDPATGESWYTPEELELFRLSSKSHWDVPIDIDGTVVHALASHPTPPVFDGDEDRNGTRNHDEIRLWADYVQPGQAGYVYDDAGQYGGLGAGESFVILGDQNADPFDGDSVANSILQLLDNPAINGSATDPLITPASLGAVEAASEQGGINDEHRGEPAFDTADFFEPPGNIRADYVLPSTGTVIENPTVEWATQDSPYAYLNSTSDHFLVHSDLTFPQEHTMAVAETIESIEFIGQATFPTDWHFDGTQVGGLSGITYDDNNDVYYVLSDDRSDSRFYTATINLANGTLQNGDVTYTDVTTLLDDNGDPVEDGTIDPEGIALTDRDTLFIASEGDANQVIDPFVNEFTIGGEQFKELPIDLKYVPNPNQFTGIRNNLAFESATVTPDNESVFTAVENALYQDGTAATLDEGSQSRIRQWDADTGEVMSEYIYNVDKIPDAPVPADAFATNGLVELLALDNAGTLLSLERAFSEGVGNSVKLFELTTDLAEDVNDIYSLTAQPEEKIAEKDLVLDLDELGIPLDNLEGMTWGPDLADGRKSLIMVSDNNFSDSQFTQYLAFAVDVSDQASMMVGLDNADTDYDTDATFTVGTEINGYTPPGILDGIGAFALDSDTVRLLVNHEISLDETYDNLADVPASYFVLGDKSNPIELTGARVSFFDINKETYEVEDAGLAYNAIFDRNGDIMNDPEQFFIPGSDNLNEGVVEGDGNGEIVYGFSRFCSSALFEPESFGDGLGLVDRIYFTGEETNGGTEWALDVASGDIWAVPMMGRGNWENITLVDTGTEDKVAFLLGDDAQGRPLSLYVGDKDMLDGAGFLARNGLAEGTLYQWKADDGATTPDQFIGDGTTKAGTWVEVPNYDPALAGTDGYDSEGYLTQDGLGAFQAENGTFQFSRPEDVSTNPFDGMQVVMASTGREQLFDGADTWGTVYTIDLDFDASGNPLGTDVTILYSGDQDLDRTLRSPDNLDWSEDGYIYVQEDRSTGLFSSQANSNETSIVRLDPDALGGDPLRIAEMNRDVVLPVGSTDSDPDDVGDWESSGILDVSTLFDEDPGSLFVFDVQAHSIRDGIIAEEQLVQGGQLLFLGIDDKNPDGAGEVPVASSDNSAPEGGAAGATTFAFIGEEAGFQSAIGWFDASSGEAEIVLANASAPEASGFTTDLDLSDDAVWFLVPDAYRLNTIAPGGGYTVAEQGGIYKVFDANGNALLGRGEGFAKQEVAYFSDMNFNADGTEHVAMANDGTMSWEDLWATSGDGDFDDVVVQVTDALIA